MAQPRYELVVRWPTQADPIDRLFTMNTYPLARTPRQVDVHDAHVWVASGSDLVARFRSRGWVDGRSVKLLDGITREGGGAGRLRIQPGSVKIMARPIPMASIPGGSANPFRNKHAIRYLQARPRAFVSFSKPRGVHEVDLPITSKEKWLQQTREQASHTSEGLKHATEADLVMSYGEYRKARTKRPLIRHRIQIGGRELLTDAFDRDKNLLIEAKGETSRAAIRMAIGQVLDYGHALLPKRPRLAVLLPQMPADDLLSLASSLHIGVIWRQRAGGFSDSAGGSLTT